MSIPPLQRAILQTSCLQDYQDVISKPFGTFSLQSELGKHHGTLELSQQIPASGSYPEMIVVDLIPATVCQLNDLATFVVLPPNASKRTCGSNLDEKPEPVASDEWVTAEPMVSVILHDANSSTLARPADANFTFFELLGLDEEAVVQLKSEWGTTAFTVVSPKSPTSAVRDAPEETASLWVDGVRFQNIRRLVVYRSLMAPQMRFSFSEKAFQVPLDWFSVLEDSTGEAVTYPRLSIAQKIFLSPATDDFVLQMLFGDAYGEYFGLLVEASRDILDGLMVCEGDVIHIPVLPPNGATNPGVSGADVVETVCKLVHHKLDAWEGVFVSETTALPTHMWPVCVRAVSKELHGGPAVIKLKEGTSMQTQLSVVSQSFGCRVNSLSPYFAPAQSALPQTEFHETLCKSLKRCLHSQGGHKVHLFVVQGAAENLPSECIAGAAEVFGLPTCFASLNGLEEKEITLLLHKFGEQTSPMALVLKGAESITADHSPLLPLLAFTKEPTRGAPKILFLVAETIEPVSPLLSSWSEQQDGVVVCGNPSESDRRKWLDWALGACSAVHHVHRSHFLSLDSLVSWTTGLPTAALLGFAAECVVSCIPSVPFKVGALPVLSDMSCEDTLQRYLKVHGYSVVSTKLQPVRWSDVGGLEEAKKELQQAIQLPILHPELFSSGVKKRAGILFYGPPGCGKTLLAKAVATEMNLNFMSVKGPELINQYVGESERNIRVLFQKARDNSPCIVFFDELDALAPARGAKGDGGGAMDRIVSQLLVEVDGVGQKRSDGTDCGLVFIIGATNRPDLLDPALLRPGRFDRLCYLGIPSSKKEQLCAVQALTRKFKLDDDVVLESIIEPLDFVYTGADFFALCSDAMMNAVEEVLEKARNDIAHGKVEDHSENSSIHSEDDSEPVKVSAKHFLLARENLKASVTREDLTRYESIKSKFSS